MCLCHFWSIKQDVCREYLCSVIIEVYNRTRNDVSITCPPNISVVGFCNYDGEMNTTHGVYNWSETEVGRNDSQECEFGAVAEVSDGMATRLCESPGVWSLYYGGQCITRNTFRIQQLGNVRIMAFFRYDVIGGNVGIRWRKYKKSCMFLCIFSI